MQSIIRKIKDLIPRKTIKNSDYVQYEILMNKINNAEEYTRR